MGVPRPHVPPADTSESRRLHHFDGVRGWAALTVVVFHSTTELFGGIVPFLATGWLGLFNDGLQAVHIFFVLSGFVLSNQFFAAGHLARIRFTALGRYVRLTIPIAAAALLTFILMKSGFLLNHDAAVIVHREDWLGWFYQFPASLASYLRFVFYATYFDFDSHTAYDVVLWTMPYELIGSFLIFAMVTLFGPNRQARLMSIAAAVLLFWKLNPMYLTFLYGYLIADLNSTIAGSVVSQEPARQRHRPRPNCCRDRHIGRVAQPGTGSSHLCVRRRLRGAGAGFQRLAAEPAVVRDLPLARPRIVSALPHPYGGHLHVLLIRHHRAGRHVVAAGRHRRSRGAADHRDRPHARAAFEPVERFAILCSHRLAALVMRPETSPQGARRAAPATPSLDQSRGSEPFRSYDASRPSTRAPARSQS